LATSVGVGASAAVELGLDDTVDVEPAAGPGPEPQAAIEIAQATDNRAGTSRRLPFLDRLTDSTVT
jgi:hypothetical protein